MLISLHARKKEKNSGVTFFNDATGVKTRIEVILLHCLDTKEYLLVLLLENPVTANKVISPLCNADTRRNRHIGDS